MDFLIRLREIPALSRIAYYCMKLLGVELPLKVKVGSNFKLEHGGVGVVIHQKTRIGNNVKIFQGVTVGRLDVHRPCNSDFEIVINDNCILCAGAKVLVKGKGELPAGTIVGANQVLKIRSQNV